MSAADAVPECDIVERHSVAVDVPADRAVAAFLAVSAADVPLVALLFRLRGLPARADRTLWEELQAIGFRRFDGTTLVGEGRPWKLRERLRRPAAGGYARLALDVAHEDGRLVTETRVLLTDASARRAFRAYWLVVRPFSVVIRRLWLRAARRRALAGP